MPWGLDSMWPQGIKPRRKTSETKFSFCYREERLGQGWSLPRVEKGLPCCREDVWSLAAPCEKCGSGGFRAWTSWIHFLAGLHTLWLWVYSVIFLSFSLLSYKWAWFSPHREYRSPPYLWFYFPSPEIQYSTIRYFERKRDYILMTYYGMLSYYLLLSLMS